jgi:endoglucanase
VPGVALYIDSGHSKWQPVSEMAARLKAAGIDRADGFSLKVSNYQAVETELAYGRALSAALGGEHFVIDTSREGNGPAVNVSPDDERAWCNPPGRALGPPPSTQTGEPRCDAFLWLPPPANPTVAATVARPRARGGRSARSSLPATSAGDRGKGRKDAPAALAGMGA